MSIVIKCRLQSQRLIRREHVTSRSPTAYYNTSIETNTTHRYDNGTRDVRFT